MFVLSIDKRAWGEKQMPKVFLEHSGEKRILTPVRKMQTLRKYVLLLMAFFYRLKHPPFDIWFEPHIMRKQDRTKIKYWIYHYISLKLQLQTNALFLDNISGKITIWINCFFIEKFMI